MSFARPLDVDVNEREVLSTSADARPDPASDQISNRVGVTNDGILPIRLATATVFSDPESPVLGEDD